jgi:ATP synthase protein I
MQHQNSTPYDDETHEPPMINLADPALPREPVHRNRKQNDSPWSALGIITQLGLVMALCIVGSVMGGVYLDRLVGSNGIIVLIMIPVGIGAAVLAAWQIIKQELP